MRQAKSHMHWASHPDFTGSCIRVACSFDRPRIRLIFDPPASALHTQDKITWSKTTVNEVPSTRTTPRRRCARKNGRQLVAPTRGPRKQPLVPLTLLRWSGTCLVHAPAEAPSRAQCVQLSDVSLLESIQLMLHGGIDNRLQCASASNSQRKKYPLRSE